MKLVLNFGILTYKSFQSLGLNDSKTLGKVLHEFQDIIRFDNGAYWGIEGGNRLVKYADINSALKGIDEISTGMYVLTNNEDVQAATLKITLGVYEDYLKARVFKELKPSDFSTEIENLIHFYQKSRDLFSKKVTFPFISEILDWGETKYSVKSAPRVWEGFNKYAVVDIIDLSQAEDSNQKRIQKKLQTSHLPAGVERIVTESLCIVNWAEGLKKKEDLKSRLSIRAEWFYENADFPVDEDKSADGDSLFSIINPVATEYLTFYSSFRGAGYKATVLGKNGNYDEELFLELKEWLSKKATPDGKRITQMNLIFPTRQQAVAARPIADEFGFKLVLYPADDGNYWNPFPEDG